MYTPGLQYRCTAVFVNDSASVCQKTISINGTPFYEEENGEY